MAARAKLLLFLLQAFLVTSSRAADCNNLLADIVFVLDASGSVGAGNFATMKTFIVNFIQRIQTHVNPNSIRLAAVTFSSGASVNFYLQDRQFAQHAINGINAIGYTRGGTNTAAALNTAGSVLSTNGARVGVTKLAVLLTDGRSNNAGATQTAASTLRASGVRIMAIGVGSGINHAELQGVASSSSYVHTVADFSSLATIQNQLMAIACEPVCSWHTDHCWPGDCNQYLAANCVCRPGFTLSAGSSKRCQLSTPPDLVTCRLSLVDAHGNEVRSGTSGTLQHCDHQQDDFMNTQPTAAVYHLKADLHLSVGSFPYYVAASKVGVVGAAIRVTKVSLSGAEQTVKSESLTRPPFCLETVTSTSPANVLDCDHNVTFAVNLVDGERLCADVSADAGGFYRLQDYSANPQGQHTFPSVSKTRRICFTYDVTRPAHCSDPALRTCTAAPMRLSTRITRSPNIRVSVPQWLDPAPQGGTAASASKVSGYKLEVLGVDVASTFLSVQENAQSRMTLTGSPPYDVEVTLPAEEPRLYAVLLEVHDRAGNVGYARRMVFYDKSSRVVLDPHRELQITSANPSSGFRWQTARGAVCVSWTDRFYNDVFFHHNYLLPVKADTARAITGHYDQISGILPVSGTPTVRGVDTFEVAWSVDGGVQSAWTNVQNVTSQTTCLALATQDGQTYDVTVRATDVIGNTNSDVVRLHVDHSQPEVQERGLRGRWERDGLHVHGASDLSLMVLVMEMSDPHSGLRDVVWTVGTRPLADDVGSRAVGVQRLANGTNCSAGMFNCYCPIVGACETFVYNITFNSLVSSSSHQADHHRDYYVTVNVTNNAGLRVTQQVEILIDVSPPSAGVAMEGPADGAEEADFTSARELHVRWHGFGDPESGVALYRVVVAGRCLSDQEMDSADNATEVAGATSASFTLPAPGRYYTNVVAYNAALSPSPVACSDGVTYDTTPPRLGNVSIAHARTQRALGCTRAPDEVWLLHSNLTRTRLANTTGCSSLCRPPLSSAPVDHLPLATPFAVGEPESDEICRTLPMMKEDSWLLLPSDRLVVSWTSEDPESEMEEFMVGAGSSPTTAQAPDLIPLTSAHVHHTFHLHHSGLGQGTIFYLFIRALSKANLHAQLVLGPIVVDSTPADVTHALQASVEGDAVVVAWGNDTFVDLEQPKDVEFEVTFRVGHDEGFVTSFLPTERQLVASCRARDSAVAGCVQYPVDRLLSHDARAPRRFFLQLHVQNAAGHVTAVNSSAVLLPSSELRVVVADVLATAWTPGMAWEGVVDVDVVVMPDRLCVAWSPSLPADATAQLGVGTTQYHDDVLFFSDVDSSENGACVDVMAVPAYTHLFLLLKVNRSGVVTLLTSDGLTAVPAQDGDNVLQVFNGRGCRERDTIGRNTLSLTSSSPTTNLTTAVPLHTGDVVYVRFQPFLPHVQFHGAAVAEKNVDGYQVVVSAPDGLSVTASPADVTTIDVQACLKDASLLADREVLTATWEIAGPWTYLIASFQVQVVDRTCEQQSGSAQPPLDTRRCLLAETRVPGSQRSASFPHVDTFPGHAYTTSVAVCLHDQCLPASFSRDVTKHAPLTWPSVTLRDVMLLSQSPNDVEVTFSATVFPSFPQRPCLFQWTLATAPDSSKRVSRWHVRQAADCSNIEVKDVVSYTGSGHGTLYGCVQPLFPVKTNGATCKKFVRAPVNNQIIPFHVIEISHNSLRSTDLTDLLHSQQLGTKLHDLYDLDLDFVKSDLLLSAVATNSYRREVTWFLTKEARVPDRGDCAEDPVCVSSEVSNDGTVTFARDAARLENRQTYFVCALVGAWDMAADQENRSAPGYIDSQEVCGNGFIVDDDPPLSGSVEISDADSAYVADGGQMLVTWSGFSDVESYVTALDTQATLNFSVALGSYGGADDLAAFTSVGQRTAWTFHDLQLTSGTFCMATVRAEDHVGHVTEVTSHPVLIDNTPPSKGRVWAGHVTGERYVASHVLRVQWDGVTDPESGIATLEVAVSMDGGHDDVIPFRRVYGNSVVINGSMELVDGHSYIVLLKSTNRAGLTSLTSSEAFVADMSPPTGGAVWNGPPSSNEHVRYVTDAHVHSIHWGAFEDPDSGLAYYRVGLGSRVGQDDVTSFQYVGLQTAFTWRRAFDQGKWYYATVQVCNHARLCSTSSRAVMFDDSPPTSGLVIVGGNGQHSRFHGHNTTLTMEWPGFADPQSDIREFRWCLGKSPKLCDIIAQTNAFESRGITAAGLALPVGTPLYATVQAFNWAGLSCVAVSDSFIVDLTPPEVVVAPHFLSPRDGAPTDRQLDRSVLRLGWLFRDPESSVVSHVLSVRGQSRAQQAAQRVSVGADDHVTIQLEADELLADGDRHVLTVTACNGAGLCTTVTSSPLLVDSTPPTVGRLMSPMSWGTVMTSSSSSSSSSPHAASNATGNSTQPPSLPVTRINVAWGEFSDSESGISRYHVTVGRTYGGAELSRGTIVVDHDNSTATQSLLVDTNEQPLAGELLVFSVRAENSMGQLSPDLRMTFEALSGGGGKGSLLLQRHSCLPHYCTGHCTCAPRGQVCDVTPSTCTKLSPNDTSLLGVTLSAALRVTSGSQNFVTSAKCLTGDWGVSDASFLSNISRFEWSFGLSNMAPGAGVFDARHENIWHDAGHGALSATHCLPGARVLTSGSNYVLHVRAWLSYDTYVVVTSPSVLADHSPPAVRRGRSVTESDAVCTRDLDFVTENDVIVACWNGVFSDTQTGIARYEIWVGTTPFGDDYMPGTFVGLSTTFTLDRTSMVDGTRYYVSVRAWNGAGLATTALSDGVTRDTTPPTLGVVFAGSRHAGTHANDDVTTLSASWHGFQDLESGVTSYSVALYDAADVSTPVLNFLDVGFLTKFTFHALTLEHGRSYKVAVKAKDAAGLESAAAMSPAILADVTPPEGLYCTEFTLERETTLTYAPTSSPHHTAYRGTLDVTASSSGEPVQIVVSATLLPPGARADISVGGLTTPLPFRYSHPHNASASLVFAAPTGGTSQAVITVKGKSGATITATVFSCQNTLISTSGVVTIRQVSPFAVSVHVTARDSESGIASLMVGIGSTPGGVQVQALTPVGQGGQGEIEVTAQQGSPLYALLIARNHAGSVSRFVSQPVTMDTTGPVVSEVQVTLLYDGDQTNTTNLTCTARAEWTAVDPESGPVICSCQLVGHATSDDVVQFTSDVTPGACEWELDKPRAGEGVQVEVDCVNQVQIHTMATSPVAKVLLQPPDLSQIALGSLPNYGQFSPFDSAEPTVRSSNSSLEFFWRNVDDPTVTRYEYRFLRSNSPLIGWTPLPSYKTAAMMKRDDGLAQDDVITAEVRAVNSRQMTSEVAVTMTVLDDSKPTLTGKKATAGVTGNKLHFNWAEVFHTKHDVTYAVYAGTKEGFGDVINHHVTTTTSYDGPCDPSLGIVYVAVQAIYVNGLYEVYTAAIVL